MSPLPIPRQITLDIFPPLQDLLVALSPIKARRLWVQTLLFEYVHGVLELRVPVLARPFLRREREEQGFACVERDLSMRK